MLALTIALLALGAAGKVWQRDSLWLTAFWGTLVLTAIITNLGASVPRYATTFPTSQVNLYEAWAEQRVKYMYAGVVSSVCAIALTILRVVVQ